MNNSELLARLSKIKRNSFKQIPNLEINNIVKSLNDDTIKELVPGIHEDIDLIVFKYCFYSRKDLPSQLEFVKPYLRFMNSWYDVDCCLSFIKAPIDLAFYLPISQEYINDPNPFIRRLGYVILLKADLASDETCASIIKLIKEDDNINVRMAQGWLLSFMVIKNYKYMLAEFKKGKMPYSIVRIGISKSLDSYCVSKQEKDELKRVRMSLREKEGDKE